MKIRFSNTRTVPEDNQGIHVQYAPAKRQAFKLRWYLLLLLIASPLLFAAWMAINSWWEIEAPGYVSLPVLDITAPQSGIVERILVSENSSTAGGTPLLQLRKPELDSQLSALDSLQHSLHTAQPATTAPVPATGNKTALAYTQQLTASYRRLFAQGAATRAELNEAEARLAALQPASPAITPTPVSRAPDEQQARLNAERQALQAQQQALLLKAPAGGQIQTVLTHEGLAVQQGQKLLTLQLPAPAKIIALLPASHANYARAGQAATLVLPNGDKLAASVLYNGTATEQVPDVLQALGTDKQGILLQLMPQQALPPQWQLNKLPVRITFTRQWPWQSLAANH